MTTNHFPNSEKTFKQSDIHQLNVPFRKINLDDPTTNDIMVYDTSGEHNESPVPIDYKKGIKKDRDKWVLNRDVLCTLSPMATTAESTSEILIERKESYV